jgi:glycosyltransferase involved in cell wall biosynthesis
MALVPPLVQSSPLAQRPVQSGPCLLTVVVPCYNEEEVLPETCRRLCALLDRLTSSNKITGASQVILVDDGSRDRTWEVIRSCHGKDRRIRGLKLSANRGHQTALICRAVRS